MVELPKPKQWEVLSVVPILAGLFLLLAHSGWGWLLWALIPGSFLLMTGMALLFMPGDQRILSYMGAAGLVGALLFLPLWIAGDFASAVLALAGCAGSFLVAGRVGLLREPLYIGATPPRIDTTMDVKAGLDEAVLGYFVGSAIVPSGDLAAKMCDEAFRLEEAFKARGWDHDASGFHPQPPAPAETYVDRGRAFGYDFEILRFDSQFNPDDALPGAALWKTYEDNHRCHVRILRHPGKPRPWLMCVHGYRMGVPLLDFGLFSPDWLHERLGLNIIQPVLPLHGPRKIGARTGDYFLDGDLLDLVYAEAQSLWDLRRTLAWLRATEDNPRVGVFGFSLGGYNTALLAGFEAKLDFAIAVIPVADFASALWKFMPPAHGKFLAHRGLNEERYRQILGVVSPLARPCLLPPEKRHILAATGDRIVVPWHPLKLSEHWGVPATWYQGSHLSVRRERATREVLDRAIAAAGWRSA